MGSNQSSGNLISKRYASALYDLASETKVVESVLNDLKRIKKLLVENKEMKLLTKSPLIASKDKLKIFLKLLTKESYNDLSSSFLKVIAQNKRFANLVFIINQFININAKKRGDVLADITSADELSDEQKNNVKEQLRNILGDKLSLDYKVDKKILGGLIIKVGSKMIDTSLLNKINKLKIAMKEV